VRRGWFEGDVAVAVADLERRGLVSDGQITAAGRRLRDDIEARTDAMEQAVIDAIGDDLEATVKSLESWSAACVRSGVPLAGS
jgi:hypothetical protein